MPESENKANPENPFRSPSNREQVNDIKQSPENGKRPSVLDCVIAFGLGAIAFAIVFPTTCIGAFLYIPGLFVLHGSPSETAKWGGIAVNASTFGLGAICAYLAAKSYLQFARRGPR
jgi:hypothetical protein